MSVSAGGGLQLVPPRPAEAPIALVWARAGRSDPLLRMRARLDDLQGTADDLLPPHRVHRREPFGDHRNVARTDLEEAVATERAAPPALQILRLRAHHRIEVPIGALEDLFVVVGSHVRRVNAQA